MTHREKLTQRVKEYLDFRNWPFEVVGSAIAFNFSLKSMIPKLQVILMIGDEQIDAVVVCPIKASPGAYMDVVEFITRANYGWDLGDFEFDYSNGRVRYHYALACQDDVPGILDLERTITIGIQMFQRFGDGLAKNLMGGGNPEADIMAIMG